MLFRHLQSRSRKLGVLLFQGYFTGLDSRMTFDDHHSRAGLKFAQSLVKVRGPFDQPDVRMYGPSKVREPAFPPNQSNQMNMLHDQRVGGYRSPCMSPCRSHPLRHYPQKPAPNKPTPFFFTHVFRSCVDERKSLHRSSHFSV